MSVKNSTELTDARAKGVLQIGFEGYFTSRISTDPDPTNEQRGVSGYTMALAKESKLDQVIRLQVDEEYLKVNRREPMRQMQIGIGVCVTSVKYQGDHWAQGASLLGANVNLAGKDEPLSGAIFESRNNTVGSDDTMSFVITPFDLRINADGVAIRAVDFIDPSNPNLQPWEVHNPNRYLRRLTTQLTVDDVEVAEAIGVFDVFGYFRDRREFLRRRKQQQQEALEQPGLGPDERDDLRYQIEAIDSRLYQIEFWGDRISSKLRTKCTWEHDINGDKLFQADVGGCVDTSPSADWQVKYWFGGWDGDLLTGYMRGTLAVPFTPG